MEARPRLLHSVAGSAPSASPVADVRPNKKRRLQVAVKIHPAMKDAHDLDRIAAEPVEDEM